MLVQSGRPVGVMQTHEWAPRVLIANSNLVGDWATWPEFRRLEHLGLTMYGQMTAGSWIYIGTQGIVQGTYETFAAVAEKRFGGTLAGTLTLTGGCGGMGGAQPLAVTMNEGVCLDRRRRPGAAAPPGRAPLPRRGRRRPRRRHRQGAARPSASAARWSVGVVGNAAEVFPELLRRGVADRHRHRPDRRRTTRCRYLPEGVDARGLGRLRREEARGVHRPGPRLDGQARPGDGRVPGRRRRGLRLRQLDPRRGPPGRLRPRVRVPRLRAGLHPAAVLRGQGPVPLGRAVGRPEGHRRHRQGRARPVPGQRPAAQVDPRRPGADRLPGPAGPDLLARLRRARQGGPGVQRAGRAPGRSARRSSSAATTSTAARWPARTARPRRWPTAPTRSPTGRCSTPWSTPRPAPAGSRSTTAAASASAAPSTPARSRSPTAPTSRRRSSRGCSPTTPAWASSGTSTPATTSPSATSAGRAGGARRPRTGARVTPVGRVRRSGRGR